MAVFAWKDELAIVNLPTMNPLAGLTRLRKTGEHAFRRVRRDGELGETVRFEMDAAGRPLRLVRHNNYYPRIEPAPAAPRT